MKITAIKVQSRDKNRVNVFVDGKYRFSLELAQVVDLGIRVGLEFDEPALNDLINESQYGKLYARSLEYALVRPRSQREMRDYLRRKTLKRRNKQGELVDGVSKELTERVYCRLVERGHLDDVKFVAYWVENRNIRKGISQKKLRSELLAKGVDSQIIDDELQNSERSEADDIQAVIRRKAYRYSDDQKFIAYLAGQGFSYDLIKQSLADFRNSDEDV